MIVVKVGGSLYDHPNLGPGLRNWLATLDEPVLLVPGGGPFAEAVRELDRIHGLGESSSHWLALQAMDLAGAFLQSLRLEVPILNATAFCRSRNVLPESWSVTSDSIAALAALVNGATRLVLLKSIDIPLGTPWPEAAMRGWVDQHFPSLCEDATISVETVNFRARLEND